jgi:acetylornithine deacetylase/succinyl-diaminopimelate desuccinylase-like protein
MGRQFRALSLALLATLAAAPIAAQQPALAPHQQLLHDIYKELIEINTGPKNGSTVAAQAVATRLREAGFPDSDIFVGGPIPEKFNVVVRYHGPGGANAPKPLLLLAHLDVVEALKADWSPDLDPFVFTERDGYYYGRGTSDDKAMAAIFVANLVRLKREGFKPARDIVVAVTADEEGGGSNGVSWLLTNHRDLIDPAYVINEGGGGSLRNDKPFWTGVQATEKVTTNFTLTARNKGGHSSVPRPDNAIYQLAAALGRLGAHDFPVQLNDVTRAFLTKMAAVESPEVGAAMRAVARNPEAPAAATLARDPRYNSMMRTTCVATMLSGGHASNALPQTATATVNCRMVPNVPPSEVRDEIVRTIADPGIEVSAARAMTPTSPSPLLPEVFGPIETVTRELFGDIPVIPVMSTGASDSRFFRSAGIPAYGVSGLFSDPDDSRAHGRDERMSIKWFYQGQEFLYRLAKSLAAK